MPEIIFYNIKLGIIFTAFCLLFFIFGAFTVTFTPAGQDFYKRQHAPTQMQSIEHIKANFARVTKDTQPVSTKHLPNAIKQLLKEQ